jgi:hypothetical protein
MVSGETIEQAQIDDRRADRLAAVLQGRIDARRAEPAFRRIIGRDRGGKHADAGKRVQQTADARDVVRSRPAFLARFGIEQVRRRARGGDDQRVAGNGLRTGLVARMEGEARRNGRAELLDDFAREPDDLRPRIGKAAMPVGRSRAFSLRTSRPVSAGTSGEVPWICAIC